MNRAVVYANLRIASYCAESLGATAALNAITPMGNSTHTKIVCEKTAFLASSHDSAGSE